MFDFFLGVILLSVNGSIFNYTSIPEGLTLLTISNNNTNNKVITFKDDQKDIDCLLSDTTCVKVIFDTNESDYVKIMLPNNQMAKSNLTLESKTFTCFS